MAAVWRALDRFRILDAGSGDEFSYSGGLGVDPYPAAVQGRVGEYKGVWLVSPLCGDNDMWVRPSMKKQDVPPECRTVSQAQFEVSVTSALAA